MNPKLRVRAARSGGVFSRRDALECAYTPEEIRWRLRTGRWRRIRFGYYAEPPDLADLEPWERRVVEHRFAVHAAMRASRSGRTVVSHVSALVLHGIPVWDVDLGTVHLTRLDGVNGRMARGVHQHLGRIHEDDLVELDGLRMTSPARALVESAGLVSYESAVVSADAVLRRGLITRDVARRLLDETRFWPGGPRTRAALAFADGRSESVGESRLRVLFDRQALPRPQLQTTFHDHDGFFVARVDFFFAAQRVVVEFDGLTKYGAQAQEAVLAEKEREDRLRALGVAVVRVTWADLDHPEQVAARIRRALAAAA